MLQGARAVVSGKWLMARWLSLLGVFGGSGWALLRRLWLAESLVIVVVDGVVVDVDNLPW